MTSIKLRADVLIAQQHVAAGTVVSVEPNLARYLVGCGKAEFVDKVEPGATLETATAATGQKAVMPKAKKRQG